MKDLRKRKWKLTSTGLRVDAERNRQRIVAAAREAFAELGLDVSMEEIARRAGVGIGTLYRRYPTRPDLVAAAFEAKYRDRAFADFVTLVDSAKAAGKLRPDFVAEDMPMFLMANAGVLTATADAAPEAWRRLVGYLLQACAAPAAHALPDPPAPG